MDRAKEQNRTKIAATVLVFIVSSPLFLRKPMGLQRNDCTPTSGKSCEVNLQLFWFAQRLHTTRSLPVTRAELSPGLRFKGRSEFSTSKMNLLTNLLRTNH